MNSEPASVRKWTRDDHLQNVQAIAIGVLKLVGRALTGDPAEADSNIRCAAYWLRVAADELDALTPTKKGR